MSLRSTFCVPSEGSSISNLYRLRIDYGQEVADFSFEPEPIGAFTESLRYTKPTIYRFDRFDDSFPSGIALDIEPLVLVKDNYFRN